MRSANLTTVGMRVLSVIGQRVFVSVAPDVPSSRFAKSQFFEFSGRQTITISCSWIQESIRILFSPSSYYIRMHCLACSMDHVWNASFTDFGKVLSSCASAWLGVDASYLCDPDEVSNVIESLDALVPIEFLAVTTLATISLSVPE